MKKYCEECGREVETKIINKKETYDVCGEPIEVDAQLLVCAECGEELFCEELDNATLVNAYNNYRRKHKLLLPEVDVSGNTTETGATLTFATTSERVITFPDATCTLAAENRNPTLTIGAHDYAAGSTDWTLNAAELLLKVHKPTNANAPVNAIVSTAIKEYLFINGTGQNLVVKTAAGTGVTIANTKAQYVFCDGTNVIAAAPVGA